MKSVLVTGGAGFIGSNFIRHMFHKYPDYKIVVLDALTYAGNIEHVRDELRSSERSELWYGNLNNLDLVDDLVERSQIIVHFAAETHVARSLYLNRVFFITDVLGTQAIANAVLKHSDKIERFIHISTSEVLAPPSKNLWMKHIRLILQRPMRPQKQEQTDSFIRILSPMASRE